MKKLIISSFLVLGSLISIGQSKMKVDSVGKAKSDSIASISVNDIIQYKEALKNIPYKDYQILTPDLVLNYLVLWIKNGKK